mmetsp:Transcript_69397/g.167883  ORF Transcript_69397/g.167883 Transcript_69397/m.167883 type:complete len:140 (+) Transcript_69397:150-569(+)
MAAEGGSAPPAGGKGGAGGAGGSVDAAVARNPPRVGSSGPVRMHVLMPPEGGGDPPPCDCGKQHLVYGQTYKYCTCGRAERQPLCDGKSCEGTGYAPREFVVDKRQTFYLMCACKRTQQKDGFMCDGRHSSLTREDLSW